MTLTIEDRTVPVQVVNIKPTENNSVGVDAGLEYFAAVSDGKLIKSHKLSDVLPKKNATYAVHLIQVTLYVDGDKRRIILSF